MKKFVFLLFFTQIIALILIGSSLSGTTASENNNCEKNRKEETHYHSKDDKDTQQSAPNKRFGKSLSRIFIYNPPERGKPGSRLCNIFRGKENDQYILAALVPDHTGLTCQPNPALYWYLSKPTTSQIKFILNNEHSIKPILEINIDPKKRYGIQCIRLSDYGATLALDVKYEWFIALVEDHDNRLNDIITRGTIKRISLPPKIIRKLTKASSLEIPAIYAQEGMWYDAFSIISELIEAYPGDMHLREQRTSLLEQGISRSNEL